METAIFRKLIKKLAKDPGAPRDFYELEDGLRAWALGRISDNHSPKTKARHVGIEIEFYSESERELIAVDFVASGLASKVSLTEDRSLDYDGHELKILDTETGVFKTLKKALTILKKHNAYVNEDCGLHVHLDMRHRNADLVYENFIQIQPLLFGLVAKNRADNTYCKPSSTMPKKDLDRYSAINFESMKKFKTIEIRLHQGSTNYKKITNWLKLLFNVANRKKKCKKAEKPSDLSVRGLKAYLNSTYKKGHWDIANDSFDSDVI